MAKKLWEKLQDSAPENADDYKQMMRETPITHTYYQDAYDRGLVNEEGQLTARGVEMNMGRDKQALVREGRVEDDDNLAKTVVDSVSRTSQEMFASYANTFGFEDKANAVRHRLSLNQELAPKQWSDGGVQWFFDSLASGVTQFVPLVVAAKLGAPQAGIVSSFARMWGDNYDQIKETAPTLSTLEATGINVMLTGMQTGIEYGMGVEKHMMGLTKGASPTRGLAAAAKTQKGQSLIRRAASEFFDPSNPLTGAFSGAVQETLEETFQAAVEIGTMSALGKPLPEGEELAERLIYEPLRALPAGLAFGAFNYSRNKAKSLVSPDSPTAEDAIKMHTNPSTGEVDQESIAKEDQAFSALRNGLTKLPGVQNVDGLVDTIRAISWAFAKAAKARGEELMPVDFIETVKTAFIEDNLDGATISQIVGITTNKDISATDKTTQILDLLSKRAGSESAVYKMFNDVTQEIERTVLQERINEIKPLVNRIVPQLRDKEAKARVKASVESLAKVAVGPKASEAAQALAGGVSIRVPISGVAVENLTETTYGRLLVEPQTITVNNRNVQVSAKGGHLIFRPLQVVKQEAREEIDKAAQVEAETRQEGEKARGAQPLNKVIDSDIALASAKAEAAGLFSKYTSLTDELETYRHRVGTKLDSDVGFVEIPVAQAEVEVAEEAAEDVEEGAEVEEGVEVEETKKPLVQKVLSKLPKKGRKADQAKVEADTETGQDAPDVSRDWTESTGDQDTGPKPLFSISGKELRGLYFPDIAATVFFKNADESTVLHEFLHHARALLPEEVQADILKSFGEDSARWTVHAEEKFVDSILTYMRDGNYIEGAPERFRKGVQAMIPILKEMISLNETKLSERTLGVLNELFGDVQATDIHRAQAEAAQAGMDQEGPTSEQALESTEYGALLSLEPGTEEGATAKLSRNKLYAHVYAIAGKAKIEDKDATVHQMAADIFDWFTDGSSLKELSDQELKRLAVAMAKRYDDRVTIQDQSPAVEDLVAFENTKKDVYQDRRIKYSTKYKERAYSWLNNWRKLVDKHDMYFTSPKFLAVKLDNYSNDGPYHRYFADPIDKLQHDAAKVMADLAKVMHKSAQARKLDVEAVAKKRVNLGGYTATVGRAVQLALADIDVDGETSNAKKAIMRSNNTTEQEFKDAVEVVKSDPEAQALMEHLVESYSTLYDTLAPVYEKVTGEKLKKVPNYFALMRVDGNFAFDDLFARVLESVDAHGKSQASSRYSMIQERKAIHAGKIDLDNAVYGLHHYAAQAANYIAKAEAVKQLGETIGDKRIGEALTNSYGREQGEALHKMMRDLLAREMFPNARTQVMSDHDRFFAWARQSFTMAMLGFRPMVWIAQLASRPTFYSLLKGGLSPSTIMQDITNTATLTRILGTNSLENRKRAHTGQWKEEGYVHWLEGSRLLWTDENGEQQGLWPKYAQHILESHGNPATGDVVPHGFKGVLGIEHKGVPIGELAMEGVTIFDMLTVGPVWLTTFDMVVGKEMKKHGDLDRAEREAARLANDIVAKTQPPRTQFQRPAALTGSEGFKLLFPFSGQTMQNWQIWNNEVVRPSIRAVASKDFGAFFKGKTEYESGIAQRLALAFVVPALFMGFRARRRKPTEEEMIKDIMFYPISSIPAIGGTLQYMFVHDADYASVEQAHTHIINNTLTALYDIAKAATGDKKFDKMSIRNLEDALAIPFSVPTAAVRFTEETLKLIVDPEYKFDRDYVLKALSSEPKPLPE